MTGLVDDVRRAARADVTVPGTPRSLRLDDVSLEGDACLISWSYDDPTHETDAIHGQTTVARTTSGQDAWAAAQLDAGRRMVWELDLDWVPGETWVSMQWTPDEAWAALVAYLSQGATVTEVDGDLVVEQPGERTTIFRLDRAEFAAYMSDPLELPGDDGMVVPAAVPLDRGLPLWLTDELSEVRGTRGPVIELRPRPRGGLRLDGDPRY